MQGDDDLTDALPPYTSDELWPPPPAGADTGLLEGLGDGDPAADLLAFLACP